MTWLSLIAVRFMSLKPIKQIVPILKHSLISYHFRCKLFFQWQSTVKHCICYFLTDLNAEMTVDLFAFFYPSCRCPSWTSWTCRWSYQMSRQLTWTKTKTSWLGNVQHTVFIIEYINKSSIALSMSSEGWESICSSYFYEGGCWCWWEQALWVQHVPSTLQIALNGQLALCYIKCIIRFSTLSHSS